jgi:UDP:flavonoid glycosyltransferase YjiC (YdhE family)
MTTYLFLLYPASGPVNPTLALARELINRWQKVIYYLAEVWSETVRTTGALGRLREAVERVATDETIHQNGKHMQRLAREAGGYRHAVEAIMHFAQERTR